MALYSQDGEEIWEQRGAPSLTTTSLASSGGSVVAIGASTIPFEFGGQHASVAGPVFMALDAATGSISCLDVTPVLDRDQSQMPVEDIDGWAALAVGEDVLHLGAAMRGPLLIEGQSSPTNGLNDLVFGTYPIDSAQSTHRCPGA